jgi:predicted enzyme related to lactoylglutathione lyase
MQNPVVHFELPADDQERMKAFYTKAFGWEMNQMGPEMHNYTVVMTAPSDDQGPLEKGRINGGIYKKQDGMSAAPSLVISVENITEGMERIKAAGGTIEMEPMDIPGVGKYVTFIDTEGNRLSIMEPIMA